MHSLFPLYLSQKHTVGDFRLKRFSFASYYDTLYSIYLHVSLLKDFFKISNSLTPISQTATQSPSLSTPEPEILLDQRQLESPN